MSHNKNPELTRVRRLNQWPNVQEGGWHNIGDICDMPADLAQVHIDQGVAELVDQDEPLAKAIPVIRPEEPKKLPTTEQIVEAFESLNTMLHQLGGSLDRLSEQYDRLAREYAELEGRLMAAEAKLSKAPKEKPAVPPQDDVKAPSGPAHKP